MDYTKWADYIIRIFQRYRVHPRTAADLACGTGGVTIQLAQRGYQVTGVDLSEDMLFVAREKARSRGLSIPFVCQDIRDLTLHKPVDAVLCMCDGINYILEMEDLESTLDRVSQTLKPGGTFVFDISTYYKLSRILGDHTLGDAGDDIAYLWQNYFDPESSLCEMNLTFFLKEGALYKRFDETHIQRAYQKDEIWEALKKSGFVDIECYHPFSFETPRPRDQRIFFAARKPGL